MASFEQYETGGRKLWRVRYRDPSHKQRAKSGFETKRAAEAFYRKIHPTIERGEYVDPRRGRVTIVELGAARLEWRRRKLAPSTWRAEESSWRIHVEPEWGPRRASSITTQEVREWVADLADAGMSATAVKRAHGILSGILADAVRAQVLAFNAAELERGDLPKRSGKRRPYLTAAQVELLAASCRRPELGLIVRFLVATGLRWGELAALRVRDVDPRRLRIRIAASRTQVGGRFVEGGTKTGRERTVAIGPRMLAELQAQAAVREQGGFLFGDDPLVGIKPPSSRNGWFISAVRRAQAADPTFPEHLSPHDLRHTHASLAVAGGASVKALQQHLGHASAAMTLDQYADLFDAELDDVAAIFEPPGDDSATADVGLEGG